MKKKIIIFLLFFLPAFLFAQQSITVYAKANEKSKVKGQITYVDSVEELPIPKKKKKKVVYVKNKKGKKKRKVIYEEVTPKEPPTFIPVKTKFGKGFVRRAEFARFKERAADLSGKYSSSTGYIILEKSPNSAGKFNVTIQNGPIQGRAEIAIGNLQITNAGEHKRFHYEELGCKIDIDLYQRKVRVVQKGCEEYNVAGFTLAGTYDSYEELVRKAEVFSEPEHRNKFRKYVWCPEGPYSCEKIRDEDGCSVEIVWSAGGKGIIERRCDERVHKYRPFERVIPRKQDFYNGEKPIIWKTKRTDMANEWMLWYYYPKAERYKMIKAGSRDDAAYMEVYE